MERVLVTGSGGYIGRFVVKELLDLGYEVVAADINNDGVDERAEKMNVSVFSEIDNLYEFFGKPDVCIHLAWRNGFVHNSETHMTDLAKHFAFLKQMVDAGIKKLAVMGTMHEIGYFEGAIDKNTPCAPLSLYGISKNALRDATFAIAKGTDTIVYWLRAYYILGDDLKNHSIFSKIVQMEEAGQKTFPFTSGKNKYDFISVHELAKLISLSVGQEEITGIINVCTGDPKSLGEQVEDFIREHGFKIRPEYGAFPDRPYDSPAVWGNPDKIMKIIANAVEKHDI